MDWLDVVNNLGGKAIDAKLASNPTSNVTQAAPNGTATTYTEGQPAAGGLFGGSTGKAVLIGGALLLAVALVAFIAKD